MTTSLTAFTKHYELSQHPFFIDPSTRHPSYLWAVLETGQSIKSTLFGQHVPKLVAALDDAPLHQIAAIVREQLEDESGQSGRGDSHFQMYEPMLAAVEAWRTPSAGEYVAAATQDLIQSLDAAFSTTHPLHARLGAYFATEIAAGDIVAYISEAMHTQSFDEPAMKWAKVHDIMELEHTDDTLRMPGLLADEALVRAAFWRGAQTMMQAFWRYFHAIAELQQRSERSAIQA